ncbi:MAG: hypothetical protein FJ030_17525 [Chloroflexi bacterium]|nr:hypothetical protein [Chloroflexota bacterium]
MFKRFAFPFAALLSLACFFLNPTPAPTSPLPPTLAPQTPAPVPPTESQPPTSTPQVVVFPTPDVPLSQAGPWLLATDDNGLWAVNPDGSGFTNLFDKKVVSPWYEFSTAISPDGHHLAFVTADEPQQYIGLRLILLTLPEGTTQILTPLMKPDVDPFADFSDPAFEAARAIGDYASAAWSPDGRKLAFIGAQDGPSSDLYVYSLDDGSITRLTDGPSQTYGLSWSPDGKYIVHAGVESFGTGAGYSLVGMWAARADGSGVETLYLPSGGDERVIGWIDNETFITSSWFITCGTSLLRTYNIPARSEKILRRECVDSYAFDPVSKTLVYSVSTTLSDFLEDKTTGVYFWNPSLDQPRAISEIANASNVSWSPESKLFYFGFEGGQATAIDLRGTPASVPVGITDPPAVSSAGDYAWIDDNFTLQITDPSGQTRAVFDGATGPLAWSADGQSFFFTDNRASLHVARKPDFTAEKITDLSNVGDFAWLSPPP